MAARSEPRGRGALTEARAIALLRKSLEAASAGSSLGSGGRAVELGIGDDAAVVRLSGRHVWTVDSSSQGVHFDLGWLSLRQAAERAFEAALSDLAAMGAVPVGALCNLQVPSSATAAQIRQVGRGQAEASRRAKCPLIGGNLCRGEAWQFVTSVLGAASKPLTRSGARPGHEVWLIGQAGEAAAGLWLLRNGGSRVAARARARCLRAWRAPRALLLEGQRLLGRASAAIDVSDGLASDASHLAEASGVRVVLDESQLRSLASSSLQQVARAAGCDPVQWMLLGGEDYALLATGPAAKRPSIARVIGVVEAGQGALLQRGKARRALRGGFDHLKTPRG